jgi:hypothetical protein
VYAVTIQSKPVDFETSEDNYYNNSTEMPVCLI